MDAAEAALAEAERIIATAGEGAIFLRLNTPATRALRMMPHSLSRLWRLGVLALDGTQIGDAALAPLAGLSSLMSLSLAGTQVTDAGLSTLAGLGRLRMLSLASCRISDGGLPALAALSGLERLDLSDTAITDAGLAVLAPLSALKSLSLERTRITGAGFAALRALTALEEVRLSRSGVTDAGLAGLAALPGLRKLYLQHTGITGPGLAALAGKRLTDLNLTGSQVSDLRSLAAPDVMAPDAGRRGNGLDFDDTPAVAADPNLAELARIGDAEADYKTRLTLEYLATLR